MNIYNRNTIYSYLIISLSLTYFLFVDGLLIVSELSQVLIFLALLFWLNHNKIKLKELVVIISSAPLFLAQGIYLINIWSVYFSYILSRRIDKSHLEKVILLNSLLVALISLAYFYAVLGGGGYEHYFIPFVHRLVGVDRSPTMVSFTAGLAIVLLLSSSSLDKNYKIFGIIFFFTILILTASRTSIMGLLIGLLIAFARKTFFAVVILFAILSPLLFSILYANNENILIRLLLEAITSNRIINWVNLYDFFHNSNLISLLFGFGKPPIIDDPLILKSMNELYNYRFVTYAESSWLKILTYHGVIIFTVITAWIVKKSYLTDSYFVRLLIFYIVFSGIFYDSVISLQYIFFTIILFKSLDQKTKFIT